MRVTSFVLVIMSISLASPTVFALDKKIALECVGNAEEIIWSKQEILDKKTTNNVVIYYELDKDSVTEHISAHSFNLKRNDIERASDETTERSGHYRLGESEIAYSTMTRFKQSNEFTSRTFFINRKTGAWNLDTSLSGGYFGAIFGKDARRDTKYRGFCRPWDAKNKF